MTIAHRPDPYAALRASRARIAARATSRKQVKAQQSAEAEDRPYGHLRNDTLSYRSAPFRAPSPPQPTQADRGPSFAERMEQVVARAQGREPRKLVTAGPRQGVTRATGADLNAALQRREAERAAAAGRR